MGAEDAKGANWNIILMRPSLSDGKSAKDINKDAYIKAIGIKSTCIKDIYASKYTDAVKDSRIYSQSF